MHTLTYPVILTLYFRHQSVKFECMVLNEERLICFFSS